MTTALVTGSITEVALKSGKSLALAFMAIETVVLVVNPATMWHVRNFPLSKQTTPEKC
jgi:hypothetical protein